MNMDDPPDDNSNGVQPSCGSHLEGRADASKAKRKRTTEVEELQLDSNSISLAARATAQNIVNTRSASKSNV